MNHDLSPQDLASVAAYCGLDFAELEAILENLSPVEAMVEACKARNKEVATAPPSSKPL